MASYYVWSAAAGSANGSSWVNAYLTLGAAFTGKAAGDVFYVAHDHSEATAGFALNSTGTVANPSKVICVDRGGTVPPVSADRRTTAQIATTTTGAITLATGSTHIDGVKFLAGDAANSSSITLMNTDRQWLRLDNCSLQLRGTGAGSLISVAGNANAHGTMIELNNTTISFSNVAQTIALGSSFRWYNTPSALIGTAVPTLLFSILGYGAGVSLECIGVDLSAAGSGKTLCGSYNQTQASEFRFVDCKLNASVTKSAVPVGPGSTSVDFIRSGATGNFAVFRHRMSGTLDQDTAVVRSGGATDGTTPLSWKTVTTADCNYSYPFECPPIAIWNDTTGSAKTATVECAGAAGAVPNDDQVWLEVEYLGDASSPQGSFVNDSKGNLLATAAAQTVSASTWSGLSVPTSTSYSNPGGQGNRTGTITVISNLTGSGSDSLLINGLETNEHDWTAGQTAKSIVFDFGVGASQIIDEFSWFQDAAATHGSAQTFAGSNDNASYTNLSTSVAIGTSATTVVPITNTTGYRYYRLTIPGPTSNSPWIREIKFKILDTTATIPRFKLATAFTAQQKGWVYCRVKCAKPASTFYIDPLVTLS
jgi:hypothetical protein